MPPASPVRLDWPAARTTVSGQQRIEEKMSDDVSVTTPQARAVKTWTCHPDTRQMAGSMDGTVDG